MSIELHSISVAEGHSPVFGQAYPRAPFSASLGVVAAGEFSSIFVRIYKRDLSFLDLVRLLEPRLSKEIFFNFNSESHSQV